MKSKPSWVSSVFQIRKTDSWHRWAWPDPADRGLLCDVIVWMTAVSQMKWVSTLASASTVPWWWRCLTSLLSLSDPVCSSVRHTSYPQTSHTSANRTHPLLKPSSLTAQRVISRRLGAPFLSGIEPRDRIISPTVCIFMYSSHIYTRGEPIRVHHGKDASHVPLFYCERLRVWVFLLSEILKDFV